MADTDTNANHTLQLLSVTTTDLHAAIDALRRNVSNAEESVGRCVRTRHATELGNIERYLAETRRECSDLSEAIEHVAAALRTLNQRS